MAIVNDRKSLASYLIKQEHSLVKKIPFFLEAEKFEEALNLAIDEGDPNMINKIFTEIIAKQGEAKVIEYSRSKGMKLLASYAKARGNLALLKIIDSPLSYSIVQLKRGF